MWIRTAGYLAGERTWLGVSRHVVGEVPNRGTCRARLGGQAQYSFVIDSTEARLHGAAGKHKIVEYLHGERDWKSFRGAGAGGRVPAQVTGEW